MFIFDATSRLTGLHFAPAETTRAYLVALKSHVLAHGCPLAFYSDRHGVFRVNAKDAARVCPEKVARRFRFRHAPTL